MPEYEQMTETFPIDETLQKKLEVLNNEGWALAPGTVPMATYNLVREKQPSGIGAFGRLQIDDSKIFIIPASETKQ